MKNKDVAPFLNALESVKDLSGFRFALAVVRNKKACNAKVEEFKEALKPSDRYTEYDTKRVNLCKAHAKKDESGEPIVANGEYQIADVLALMSELSPISEEYQDAVSEYSQKLKDFEAIADDDAGITLEQVGSDDMPKDITPAQLEALYEMVK